ncbi:MAG: hypothetical protein IJW06_03230, partial [Clostridia bacterium]|nr:hypothetical protein [Clostridia bacterium]
MNFKRIVSALLGIVMLTVLLQVAAFSAPSVVGVSDSVVENAPGEALLFSSGYVEIDIGARQSETNVRFAEINGVQKAITENNNKYFVDLGDSDLLVEITEKTSADASSVVSTQYFYIDKANKTYRKLDMDTY